MKSMYDASHPPARPPDVDIVAGYIGGNTPYVWTGEDWARQPARWRLPIFTRSHNGDPAADAKATVTWLLAYDVPKGCTVALDFETRVDSFYIRTYDTQVSASGYPVMLYGSKSTVFSNPWPSGGYWSASWTGSPHLDAYAMATQWANAEMIGEPWDLSVVSDTVPLWEAKQMSDADVIKAVNAHADKLFRYGDHGDETPGHANSRKTILDQLSTLNAKILAPVADLSQIATSELLAELERRIPST